MAALHTLATATIPSNPDLRGPCPWACCYGKPVGQDVQDGMRPERPHFSFSGRWALIHADTFRWGLPAIWISSKLPRPEKTRVGEDIS